MKSEARHYRELLDISAVPMMKLEYYQTLRARYNNFITNSVAKLPEKPAEMCIKADSKEARDVVFNVFRRMKRGMGYV